MREPFGKKNRRVEVKPALQPKRVPARPLPQERNIKLYLYVAGGVLFLLMSGYAFA